MKSVHGWFVLFCLFIAGAGIARSLADLESPRDRRLLQELQWNVDRAQTESRLFLLRAKMLDEGK